MEPDKCEQEGLAWQTDIWNRISDVYQREIDQRFAPVIEHVITRARLKPGERVLDLGTGTGAAAFRAANLVAPGGTVIGIDISPEMLTLARRRAAESGLGNLRFREGRGEAIPAADDTFDVVLASLSLMYVIDRGSAAREISRVLTRAGRFVAAVWGPPDQCDIVKFQQIAGSFAPEPPVPGVGPGAMADTAQFLAQLAEAGIQATVETETIDFDFDNFASVWDALALVTTSRLPPDRQRAAKDAVRAAMWPQDSGPCHFRNLTQFICGQKN